MPDKIEPHFYQYGGFEVMGDCGFCGHVEDDPIHIARGGRFRKAKTWLEGFAG